MEIKRGEITISTIVTIILALVVLVVVIYGFTVGWGNLFQNILGFGGGQVNIQTIVQSCSVSCSTQSIFDYCRQLRTVIFEERGQKFRLTCSMLESTRVLTNEQGQITVPSSGLNSCDNIDVTKCQQLTTEAASTLDYLNALAKLKPDANQALPDN